MRKIIGLIVVLLPFGIYAQEKGAIGIEFNSNYNLIRPIEVNQSINRILDELPTNKTILSSNEIKRGWDVGFNINYQISQLFGIGIYSKYSASKYMYNVRTITGGTMGEPIDTLYDEGAFHITNAIIGVYTDFSINKLPFWPTERILSKFETKVSLGVGYSFSKFIPYTNRTLLDGFFGEVNPVSGIHWMGNLKIGYRLAKNKVFSSVGLQIGYQMLMTRKLRGDQLLTFKKDKTPNLNFYGLTTGIYLTFGK